MKERGVERLGVYREEKEGGPGASSCFMELRLPEWRFMMWTQASRPLGFTEMVKTVRVERGTESERE
ncbi:hypothetical protein ACFX15_035234 [Malus domestica]